MFILRTARNLKVAAPIALIATCVWLLVGCLYIPTGVNLHLTGAKRDFRPLVGDAASGKRIIVGHISRSGVEALLGLPPFASDNGRRVMYVIHAKTGKWILPLCFTIADEGDTAIGLLLTFDENGVLLNWERRDGQSEYTMMNVIDGPYGSAATRMTESLAESNLFHPGEYIPPSTQPIPDASWQLKPVHNAVKR